MKRCFIFLLAICCAVAAQTLPQPLWSVNVHEELGFQNFERPGYPPWLRQQGVTFIAPDRLVIYQVNERLSPTPLGRRDANGGAGNFFLDLKVFDTRHGHVVKSARLPTNASYSQVIAGRSGNFIVRTGDTLYLVSPDLKMLASKPLPLNREAPFEGWQMDAPPSGAQIVLVHQQIFVHEVVLADGTIASPGKSKADVEIIDPDTLRTIKQFSLSNYLLHWSAGDHFLVGTHPSQPHHAEEFGVMDFEGHWKNPKATFPSGENCPFIMDALDHNLVAAYSCYGFAVLAESGDQIFSAKIPSKEMPISVASSGNYLAVEFAAQPGLNDINLRPLHMNVFDLQSGASLLSIPLDKRVVYYDVSREGLVAVLEGQYLSVYAIEAKPTTEDTKEHEGRAKQINR